MGFSKATPLRAPLSFDGCTMLHTSVTIPLIATLALVAVVYSQLPREDPEVHYSPVSPCNGATQNLMTL